MCQTDSKYQCYNSFRVFNINTIQFYVKNSFIYCSLMFTVAHRHPFIRFWQYSPFLACVILTAVLAVILPFFVILSLRVTQGQNPDNGQLSFHEKRGRERESLVLCNWLHLKINVVKLFLIQNTCIISYKIYQYYISIRSIFIREETEYSKIVLPSP